MTPRQWLLVGVLAVVFVAVVISQFGAADTGSPPAGPAATAVGPGRRPTTVRGASAAQGATSHPSAAKTDRPWPPYTLATVLEHDPFASPAGFAAEPEEAGPAEAPDEAEAGRSQEAARKRAEREQTLAQVRQTAVSAIVATEQGLAAIVGTQTIRAGDRLHGFRVKEVRLDGLVLEEPNESDAPKQNDYEARRP